METGDAVLPFEEYRKLLEMAEDAADIQAADQVLADLKAGNTALLPFEMASHLLDETRHPLRIWREYRGLTQESLAGEADIGKSYISQIESGAKPGSVAVLKKLAAALNVDVDDLIPPDQG